MTRTPDETGSFLSDLEANRQTGCLTISSADGRVCRVYLLMGRPFHAEGPNSDGDRALADALSWPGSTVSFDDKAGLPRRQTISAATATEAHAPTGIQPLSADSRLNIISCVSLGGGCVFIAVPVSLFIVGALLGIRSSPGNAVAGAGLVSIPILLIMWIALVLRFRDVFYRDAVTIAGQPTPADFPRSVVAASGVIAGEPELVLHLRTRCAIGKLGRCSVELYANGLQITKTPDRPVTRWQSAYGDVLRAECIDLVGTGGRTTAHSYFVRLITERPRMAFLFGGGLWGQNRSMQLLAAKLREHRVAVLDETIDY